jgi:hypothetical protein
MNRFSKTQLKLFVDSRPFLYLLVVAIVGTASFVAFRMAGPLGMGLLGLLVAFVAQRIDLEKDGAVGGTMTANLYAMQIIAQQQMTRAERAAHKHETKSMMRATTLAMVIGLALVVVGFAATFLR